MTVVGVAGLWPPLLGVAYCRICGAALFAAAVLGLTPLEVMVVACLTLPGAFLVAQGGLLALATPLAMGGPTALLSALLARVRPNIRSTLVSAAFALWFVWPILGWVFTSPVLWPWNISPLLWAETAMWGHWWTVIAGVACCGAAAVLRKRS
ncbi:MAG: hypothetical protein DRP63_00670 [Planctomycetota bacterium]|nr:MAG: hypothetical protein DRP63_00670 [Planctomycetota bacterium]